MTQKFIQKSIKHPGELRRYAEKEGCIDPDTGLIKDRCVNQHLSHMPPSQQKAHLLRSYNFYHNVLVPAGVSRMESSQMPKQYQCATCGRPILGRSICRDCEMKAHKVLKEKSAKPHGFYRDHKGTLRMERRQTGKKKVLITGDGYCPICGKQVIAEAPHTHHSHKISDIELQRHFGVSRMESQS